MGYDPVELATRVVGSGLSVSEWVETEGGGIGKTSVYRALKWCRQNRPSVFGAGEAVAVAGDSHGWYQRVLAAVRGDAAEPAPEGPRGSFVRLAPAATRPRGGGDATPAPIVVELGGARVSLPAGFSAADAEAAISATARAMGVGA